MNGEGMVRDAEGPYEDGNSNDHEKRPEIPLPTRFSFL